MGALRGRLSGLATPTYVLDIPGGRGKVPIGPQWIHGDGDGAHVVTDPQGVANRYVDRLGADGVNLLNSCGAVAFQTVFHFHLHVIPRYEGDGLRLPWVPTPGAEQQIAAAAKELGRQ